MNNSSFARFFKFFPKLLAAGLLYSLSLSLCCAVFALLGMLSGFNNIIILGLGIIPSAPMLAGLTMIVRKVAIEKTDPPLLQTFFTAVKDNYKAFLLHGAVLYLIASCTFFSILYYGTLAQGDLTFLSILSIYMLFTVALMIAFFYIPLMTVTYELRLRDVYKNALLLIIGKILRNLGALALIAAVTFAAFTAIVLPPDNLRFIFVIFTVALYPLLFVYSGISVTAKGLQESVGSFVDPIPVDDSEEIAEAITCAPADSDYVFVNGKMVRVEKK